MRDKLNAVVIKVQNILPIHNAYEIVQAIASFEHQKENEIESDILKFITYKVLTNQI